MDIVESMNLDTIISELKAERDRINQAIAALEGVGNRRRSTSRTTLPLAQQRKRRGRMSAAARKRMSEQMKKRWAERKRAEARAK
jgi:hypothetical protein